MKLLTKEILKSLPRLYSTENNPDPIVRVKFFTPDANWSWWAWEYDPKEEIFFGLVEGFEREIGYFSLADLQAVRGRLGLPVERDRYFTSCKRSELPT